MNYLTIRRIVADETLEVQILVLEARIAAIHGMIGSVCDSTDLAIERGLLLCQVSKLKIYQKTGKMVIS